MRRMISSAVAAITLLTVGPITAPAHAVLPVTTSLAPPAVAVNQDPAGDRLEVFVVGSDGFAYHAWNTQPDDLTTWSAWERLGDRRFTGALAAVRRLDNSLEVYGREAGTNAVLHIRRTCIPWCGWESLAGGATLGSPAVALNRFGSPEVFVHGLDDRLYRTVPTGNGYHDWAPWAQVPAASPMRGSPTLARVGPGDVQVFFEGRDDRQVYTTTGRIGQISQAHDGRLGAAPHKDHLGQWRPVVMTATATGGLVSRMTSGGFTPWSATFGNMAVSDVAGANDPADGAAVMYARFTDESYRRIRITDGFTGGWDRVGDGSFTAPPTVVINAGRHIVFGRGRNGQIFVSRETSARQRTWSTWDII